MRSERTGLGAISILSFVSGICLASCGPAASQDISMKFSSQIGHDRTRNIAVSIFEPFRQDADTGDRLFVKCGDVSAFAPQAKVNPAALAGGGDLGRILRDREDVDFKAGETFDVNFDPALIDEDNNPWGAVIVFVEALGEALSSDGGEVPSTTLLSGCTCFRTRKGGSGGQLDATVRRNCGELEAGEATKIDLEIGPLSEPAFRLELCEGPASLTAPRGAPLSPGPRVCVRADLCTDAPGQTNCFECEQPCLRVLDKHGLPIVFTLDPPDEVSSPDENQKIVLTNEAGEATVSFDIGQCTRPIRIKAEVLGRPEYSQEFTVDCVDPPQNYACERDLRVTGEPTATAVLPLSKLGACTTADGGRFCDRLLVLVSEKDGMNQDRGSHVMMDSMDSLRMGASRPQPILQYDGERAHGLSTFFYDEAETELVVAVVTGPIDTEDKSGRLRLYRWNTDTDALELVHGPGKDNLLPNGQCAVFRCGTRRECTPGAPADQRCCPVSGTGLSCVDDTTCTSMGMGDICIEDELGERRCTTACGDSAGEECNARGECTRKVGMNDECKIQFDPQARAPMRARDTDGDGKKDLVMAISDKAPVVFFLSSKLSGTSTSGYYDASDSCECARFGTAVGAFSLVDLGGSQDTSDKVDLVYGSEAGTFVQYARTRRPDLGPYLACGQVPALFEGMAVRDVQAGRLRCTPQAGCEDVDDVVVLSDEGVSSGAIDEAGSLRVIYGGSYDLDDPTTIKERPEIVSRVFARTLPNASGAPRDPQSVRLGDFNADTHTDMAVLYRGTAEIHVWFGASNGALGEGADGVQLNTCSMAVTQACASLSLFEAVDFDGDGLETFIGFCRRAGTQEVTMRVYGPEF